MIRSWCFLLACCASAQTPFVTIQNSASRGASLPVDAFAPRSIISIQVVRGGTVPINPDLANTSVKVRSVGSGAEFNAQIVGAALGSVLAVLPAELPVGAAEVTLALSGTTYLPVQIGIVPDAPGLFVGTQTYRPTPSDVRLTASAVPGELLTLWATGLGTDHASGVSVEVGGVPSELLYAGASAQYPGRRPDQSTHSSWSPGRLLCFCGCKEARSD